MWCCQYMYIISLQDFSYHICRDRLPVCCYRYNTQLYVQCLPVRTAANSTLEKTCQEATDYVRQWCDTCHGLALLTSLSSTLYMAVSASCLLSSNFSSALWMSSSVTLCEPGNTTGGPWTLSLFMSNRRPLYSIVCRMACGSFPSSFHSLEHPNSMVLHIHWCSIHKMMVHVYQLATYLPNTNALLQKQAYDRNLTVHVSYLNLWRLTWYPLARNKWIW